MRLYVTPSGRWAGTQVDARKVASEADAGRWAEFEVPTDKPGLLAFLDERRIKADPSEQLTTDEVADLAFGPIATAPPAAPASVPALDAAKGRSRTAREIVEFILDDATVNQVENIFQAIGARFAEARS